jgi:xanthine dehydrogenase YagS FAD-binding subunit
MKAFALERAADRAAAIAAAASSATAQQGASVRFLAGGTTLVDLMKLGVDRGAGRRQPAHRRVGHQQRPRA